MYITLVNLFPRLSCTYVFDAARSIIKNANSIEYLSLENNIYAGRKHSMFVDFHVFLLWIRNKTNKYVLTIMIAKITEL